MATFVIMQECIGWALLGDGECELVGFRFSLVSQASEPLHRVEEGMYWSALFEFMHIE
jgi:hypothetical protein